MGRDGGVSCSQGENLGKFAVRFRVPVHTFTEPAIAALLRWQSAAALNMRQLSQWRIHVSSPPSADEINTFSLALQYRIGLGIFEQQNTKVSFILLRNRT